MRAKLAAAEAAGPAYARNAEALRAVQPEDVLPGDIDANLGAPWIPAADIQAFAAELFGVAPSAIPIGHLKKDAVWSVDAGYAAEASVAATAEYGTPRANGTWLLELALNMKTPVIYDTIHGGDREERVVNQEATLAAREKQKLIKERFKSWVFADPDRTERLVRLYNDTYNNLRPRLFDGIAPRFPRHEPGHPAEPAPGGRRLAGHEQRQHAARPRRRGRQDLHHGRHRHEDEAGRAGQEADVRRAQPHAGAVRPRVHAALPQRQAAGRHQGRPGPRPPQAADRQDRQRRVGRHHRHPFAASSGSACRRTTRSGSCASRSREYDQLLRDHAGGSTPRNIIKTIEKQKARREERLKDLPAEDKKDDGLVFDELGVDHVFIDEAHYFKNLETPTKMDRVAGIQTGGSERAFDLYMKARYLGEQHPGHGVTFATGTPISNTMVEMYTMQRFLDPEGLKSRGIEHFDAWAATFGEVVDTMEISPDGASLAAPQPLRPLHQPARAAADVPGVRRRADGGDARPAPAEAGRRQADRRRLPDVGRAGRPPAGAGRPLRPPAVAEGRSPRGQRPGHHHRRPQAGPRRPAAVGRRRRLPRLEDQRPGRQRRRHLAEHRRHPRHADDLLRHGRESDALGLLRL